jgi:hypothetical protein
VSISKDLRLLETQLINHLIQTDRNLNCLKGHRSGQSLLQQWSIFDTHHFIGSGPSIRCIRHLFSATKNPLPSVSLSSDLRLLCTKGIVLDTVDFVGGPYESFDDLLELGNIVSNLKILENRATAALNKSYS